MSQHVSYILNLSERYNAGNYLYYFLPGIAWEKILLYDELTKNQFSVDDTTQEKELFDRIKKLKNHWQFYKLNPDNKISDLKINIVIDTALWNFTGFGEYSRFPYVKLYVIRKIFEELFSRQELNYIDFQYFVLKNEYDDIEETISFIDKNNGLLLNESSVYLGDVNTGLINWPKLSEMEHIAGKQYPVQNLNAEDNIPGNLLSEFKTDIDEILRIIKAGMTTGKDTPKYMNFLDKRLAYLKQLFLDNIKKVKDINNISKKKEILKNFFKTFSSVNYLRKNKDVLFRFSIDTRSAGTKIRAFEELTALLVESIDFFGQDNHIDFLSGRSGSEQRFDVRKIEFDEKRKQEIFNRYFAYSQVKENLEKLYKQKKFVKNYQFNDEVNPAPLLTIDRNKADEFIYVNNLNRDVKYWYSKKTKQTCLNKLNNNKIDELEKDVQLQLGKINHVHLLEGDYGVGTSGNNMSFKEIEMSLNALKDEEKKDEIMSEVDYKKYREEKSLYDEDIKELRQNFINSLALLPVPRKVLMIFLLSVLLLFLLLAHLYSFEYWDTALIYAAIYFIFIVLAGFLILNALRSQIIQRYNHIKQRNNRLFTAFKTYVDSLKELAARTRKSTIRRMNIRALQTAYDAFKKEENQIKIYQQFYQRIVKQLEKNGYVLKDMNEMVLPPEYHVPPFLDYRIKKIYEIPSFIIKNNHSTRKFPEEGKKFVSILGIIKKIELG